MKFYTTCHNSYAILPWNGPRSLYTCVSNWWRQNMLITAMISTAYIVSGVTFPFSSYFFLLLFSLVSTQGVRVKMWNGWEWDIDTWPFLHVIMCDDNENICSSFFLTYISSSKQTNNNTHHRSMDIRLLNFMNRDLRI